MVSCNSNGDAKLRTLKQGRRHKGKKSIFLRREFMRRDCAFSNSEKNAFEGLIGGFINEGSWLESG